VLRTMAIQPVGSNGNAAVQVRQRGGADRRGRSGRSRDTPNGQPA